MTNAFARKTSFTAECPNYKNLITLRSGNKRDFVLWLNLGTKMKTNGQKDLLALRHFSCHQRELPRAFWVLSQRGGMETVNRSHAISLMCQRCREPVQSSPSDRCCQYIDALSGSLLQPSAACSWWTARSVTCQPWLLLFFSLSLPPFLPPSLTFSIPL